MNIVKFMQEPDANSNLRNAALGGLGIAGAGAATAAGGMAAKGLLNKVNQNGEGIVKNYGKMLADNAVKGTGIGTGLGLVREGVKGLHRLTDTPIDDINIKPLADSFLNNPVLGI